MSLGTLAIGVDMGDYLVIAAGLVIGLFARWSVMQSVGQLVTRRVIRIDAMIVVMNGLFATQFGETFALHGTKLAVSAAMFGASSTIVFSKLHAKFIDASDKSATSLFIGAGSTTTVPAAAPAVEVHAVSENMPPVSGELRQAFPKPTASDPAMDDLIKRLGGEPNNDY
jgi:hypothetical protein